MADWFAENAPPKQPQQDWFTQNAPKRAQQAPAAAPAPPQTFLQKLGASAAGPITDSLQVAKGAGKELVRRAMDFTDVLGSIPVVGAPIKAAMATPAAQKAREDLQPKGLGQKVGSFAEQAAEYSIPGEAEEEAAVGAAELGAKAGARLGPRAAKLGAKLAEKAVRGASAGLVSGAQTGSLKEAGETAALVGPLSRAKSARAMFPKSAADEMTRKIAKLSKEVPGGLGMTSSEMANRPRSMNRLMQYLANYSYLGQENIRSRRAVAAQNIEKAIDRWREALGFSRGPLASGKVVEDAIGTANQVFKNEAQRLYADVDKMAGNVPSGASQGIMVNTDTLKKAIATEENKVTSLKNVGIERLSKPEGDAAKVFDDARTVNPDISFSEAQHLRSQLTDILRKEGIDPQTRRITAIALDNLNHSMEDAAKKEPGLWKAYQSANDFYRHGMETFENEAIVQSLSRKPELLVKSVGPGQVSNAIAIRRAMTQYLKYAKPEDRTTIEKGFDSFRDQWIRTQLLKAPERGSSPNLLGLKKSMQEMKGPMQVLFGFDKKTRQMRQNLDTLAEAMNRLAPTAEHNLARFREVGTALGGLGAVVSLISGNPLRAAEAISTGVGAAVLGEKISDAIVNSLYSQKSLDRFIRAANGVVEKQTPEALNKFAITVRVLSQQNKERKETQAPPPPPGVQSSDSAPAPPAQ